MKSNSRTFWTGLAAGLVLTAPMFAQQVATFRAQIRGGGDHGKCTIEVDVDGVAEIEIQGDKGRMRTLSGNPAGWRRMECNQPLPQNPQGFRFSGVDGRGRQTLLRDPSSNRGTAVIRIEDPQGGREGYTFDIEWGGGFRGDGGFDRGGDRGGDRGRDDGGFRRGRNGRWDDEIRFTGRGDGNFNNFRGPDDRLYDCEVSVERGGQVRVTFQTARRSQLTFTGRLTRFDRDLIIADMSGMRVRGSMEIRLNGRDRVTDIAMSASGRERFELRWHR
ncbi:MAG: hypothetical protein LAO55_18010 [Acidobacteriia bacterium]|nr:hypothetical protein [Terriglobia bacterium]